MPNKQLQMKCLHITYTVYSNVNILYNRSLEVEYVLHVMASAAYNVNLQPHMYHKSFSMCIIQTLGSFLMSKN